MKTGVPPLSVITVASFPKSECLTVTHVLFPASFVLPVADFEIVALWSLRLAGLETGTSHKRKESMTPHHSSWYNDSRER
jgi:hypothetical protein